MRRLQRGFPPSATDQQVMNSMSARFRQSVLAGLAKAAGEAGSANKKEVDRDDAQ